MTFSTHLSSQSVRFRVQPVRRPLLALPWQPACPTDRQGNGRSDSFYKHASGIVAFLLLFLGQTCLARTDTAPGSTTQPAGTQLTLNKYVNTASAKIGDVLTYTLVLSNIGSTTAANVVARDSSTTGLRYVPNSLSTPSGTVFSSGTPISTWTVASISAGQSFSLTYQAIADSSGILYTKATIPGDTASVCTSVPVKVCTGDTYVFRLTAAPGRSNYKWFRNSIEIAGQTTNVLDVTATGTYSLAIDNVSGRCPDFTCCPFVVEEDTLPTFRATAFAATCVNGTAQANGRITLTNYHSAYTYQYSAGADFNPAASLSGTAKAIPTGGIIADNVANPIAAQPYTIRVFNASGCYTDVTVLVQPAICCSLSAVVTAGVCSTATNAYSATTVVSLTNPTPGTLTLTNGPRSTTFAITTSTTSLTAVFTDLLSDGGTHTVTASLPGCSTATTTYTAPASCSLTPALVPSLALTVTPGECQPATNTYRLSGTLSLTNAIAGTATLTDGTTTTTVSVSAGAPSVPYALTGLSSGTNSHTLTVAYASQSLSQTYTAPASCTTAPICSLSATVTPGVCQSATNTFSARVIVSIANPTTATLTITTAGQTQSLAITSATTSLTAVFDNLLSDGGTHPVNVSLPGCATTSATYTAPASCSLTPAPVPTVGLTVTPGECQTATNSYSLTGTLSLTNAIAGTATITDGTISTTVSVNAGTTSVPYLLTGLSSGTGSHTVTVGYASHTISQTYTAPASCTVAAIPIPILVLSALPNECQPATNTYSVSGTLSLSNAIAGTAIFTDGTTSTTIAVSAGTTSIAYSLTGLISGTNTHTVTISYASQTLNQTYTAPASCTVAAVPPPICSMSVTATAGLCTIATNTYSSTVVVTVTNPSIATLIITNTGQSQLFETTSATTSLTAIFENLISDGGSHIVTTSLPGCDTINMTYTAPASCSVAPAPTLSLNVMPGGCQTATNSYSISGTLSLTNAIAGIATITDGTSSRSLSVNAGATSVPYSLSGLSSGTGTHTVVISYASQTISQTYTAPASCSVAVALVCSISATGAAGPCDVTTNTFSSTVVVAITNPTTNTLTISNAGQSQTFTINSATTSLSAIFTNIPSDGSSHAITVSLPGCDTTTATYTAPNNCSIGVGLAVADPGLCQPGTNTYATTGVISLTNAIAGTATLTDGTLTTIVSVSAGATSVPYSLTGLLSGTGSRTVIVSYLGKTASTTYTAPASCSVAPVCTLTASVTAGSCSAVSNTYAASVVVNLTNAEPGTLTVSLPGSTPFSQVIKAGATSLTAQFANLVSDGVSHTATVSLPGCATTTVTFTAPASCSVAAVPPLVCSVSATAKAGICNATTNTYSATAVVTLTNTRAGTLTVTDGPQSMTFATTAATTSLTAIFENLISDGGSHLVVVALPGCDTTNATYSAPASCSVTPALALALSALPGECQPATNTYRLSGTFSLTNAIAGTATLTDGTTTMTVSVSAGATSVPYSLTGLTSGTGSHTLTVAYASQTLSQTYTAPASCTGAAVPAPVCSLSATAMAGPCAIETNTYSASVVINLTNARPGTLTVSLPGSTPVSLPVLADTRSLTAVFDGLLANAISQTAMVSLPGCSTTTATFTAPASCSVAVPPAPVCSLSLTAMASVCNAVTNTYSATAVITLTNPTPGTLTLTDGPRSTTFAITTSTTSLTAVFENLLSDGGTHTVTASLPGCSTATTTYTAPTSCSVTPAPTLALSALPGECQPATNTYSVSGTLSLSNAIAGTAIFTDGTTSTTIAISAGTTSIAYSLTGLISGTNMHTVTISYASQTLSQTYTAPASCSVVPAPNMALSVTPGSCQSATNGYTVSGTLSLTNAIAGIATITDGSSSTTTISISAGVNSVPYSMSGLVSGTGSHTVTVTYASQTTSLTYTAPTSCSVGTVPAPVCSMSVTAAAIPVTCLGDVAQADGRIVLSGFDSSYTYQYSAGASFNQATALDLIRKEIPVNGVIANNLTNPVTSQPYTVRIYSRADCYTDVVVTLQPSGCICPADVCLPFIIQQTKRVKRIGDAR